MNCPICGGNNDVCHLDGSCTRCGQRKMARVMRDWADDWGGSGYDLDEKPTRTKPKKIYLLGIKVGEIK